LGERRVDGVPSGTPSLFRVVREPSADSALAILRLDAGKNYLAGAPEDRAKRNPAALR